MSRIIRRFSYAISPNGKLSSSHDQALSLRDTALSMVEEANQTALGSRKVTRKSAFTVVQRSLESTKDLPFSLREHMAVKELSQFINLFKNNKDISLTFAHTDLLPISHPRSTRNHTMTASALQGARARWYSDDSRITDARAKAVLASAFASEEGSVERSYFLSVLSGLPQGIIPGETLTAITADGNSSFEKSRRAKLQRRDRYGRFAFQGGGMFAFIRRANGEVHALLGSPIGDAPDTVDGVQVELPGGRFVELPSSKAEYVKAIINPTKDGYSKDPSKVSTADPVINEADLKFVDAPAGWTKKGAITYEKGDWRVTFNEVLNEWEGSNGKGDHFQEKSWADIEDKIDGAENQKASLPNNKEFEFKYPDGAYKVNTKEYDPQGRDGEDSPDFTDDPVELAQNFDERELITALGEAVVAENSGDNATGYGTLPFSRGDEFVPADAIYHAINEAGGDAQMELAKIYDKAFGDNVNQDALEGSRKKESVGQKTPELDKAFKKVAELPTKQGLTEPKFDVQEMDQVPLPPLLEGLSAPELEKFNKTKDHTPFLPKNDEVKFPEGFHELDPAPFVGWKEVTAENPDPNFPEGFSDNPVYLAQTFKKEELQAELERAISPENDIPGAAKIELPTDSGENFVANIPVEAVRDALQLQGVDTNKEIANLSKKAEEIKAATAENADVEAAKKNREDIAQMMRDYGFSEDVIDSVIKMDGAGIKDFFNHETNMDKWTPQFKDSWDDWFYSWAVDLPSRAQNQRWAAFGKRFIPTQNAGDLPEGAQPKAEINAPEVNAPAIEEPLVGDFEVDAEAAIPDAIPAAPKSPNLAPDNAQGAYRIAVKTPDLQPGDITVGDHFVIEALGEPVPGTNRIAIVGHYPGHVSQNTKQWNKDTEIQVIRGAQDPGAGELPVLSKPKSKDFVGKKEEMAAAQAEYNKQLAEASGKFVDPTLPSNQPHRAIVLAANVQAGDITSDPAKGHFVIEKTFTDENTKPGFVSIEGYYPGHVSQRKEWKVGTAIDVIRNVDAPAKGDLEALHQPAIVNDGKWRPDRDPAKRAAYEKLIADAAGRWKAPEGLPVIDSSKLDEQPENPADIPKPVGMDKPRRPYSPTMPAFQGEFAQIAREAGGDWSKFREGLAGKDIIFFDYETTGFLPEDGNEPWQLGAVKVRDGKIVDRFNVYMNPGRSIKDTHAGNNAVDDKGNPLTDEFLAKQIAQEDGHKQFLEWAGAEPLMAAQNMYFDDEVMRRMADKHGLNYEPAGLLDTLPMARDILKDDPNKPKNNLGALAEFFGVKLEGWHNADVDAEATANVFEALLAKAEKDKAGANLFDVDARQAEWAQANERFNAQMDAYENKMAQWAAIKAQVDAANGADVNLDKVIADAKAVPVPNPDATPQGKVGDPVQNVPAVEADPAILEFTPNVDYPKGKMKMMDREWAMDDANTVLLPREDIRMRDLLPGDFMTSKDGTIVWQVTAVRSGEEFGLQPGRVKVYRVNLDSGEISTYEHWHGTRLDGVRRPKNPADMHVADGSEKTPIANEKTAGKPDGQYLVHVDVHDGNGVVRITPDGEVFHMEGEIFDANGDSVYKVDGTYRTAEGAEAEGKALVQRHAFDLLQQANQEQNAAPANPNMPISRGDIPVGADNGPQIIEVENMPDGLFGNIEIRNNFEDNKPNFVAEAALINNDGDVLAEDVVENPDKKSAEKEARDFIARATDAHVAGQDIAEPEAPVEPKKVSKPKKEKTLTEGDKAVIKNNDWVEENAGLMNDVLAEDIQVGDFYWNAFHKRYEEVREKPKYVGLLDRYEFKVFNIKNGQIEDRFFKADSPLRNWRRPGQRSEVPQIRIKQREGFGGNRGVIKRLPLNERVVAKTGRAMGGNFEDEGFYKDKNDVSLKPGDVVRYDDPAKDAKWGRGIVKLRKGAQVEVGKKAGGQVRGGKIYLDVLIVQFESENAEWAIKQGGREIKAKNLIAQEGNHDDIRLPDFKGGKMKPNKMGGVRDENPAPARPAGPPTTGERQNPDAEPQKPVEKISFDAIDTNDIKAKLQQLGDNFGNKGNRPTQIKNAQRAIEEFLADFDANDYSKIKIDKLDAAVRRLRREAGNDAAAQGARDITELKNLLEPHKAQMQKEYEDKVFGNINAPMEKAVADAKDINAANIQEVLDEVINRLPAESNLGAIDTTYLNYARRALEKLKNSIKNDDDINYADAESNLQDAIRYLERKPEYVKEILPQIEKLKESVAEYKKNNKKQFAKQNMPFIDPIALSEKRVADGENKLDIPNSPVLKALIADDANFAAKNSYLQPFKEELQKFFASNEATPLATLSPDARQALSQFVAAQSRADVSNLDDAQVLARGKELSRTMIALHAEKLAFNPNRFELGDAGNALLDMNPDDVFSFGKKMRMNGTRIDDLLINGQDTGFKIETVGDGINSDYNYRLIDKKSGQIFYFKKEKTEQNAHAEVVSNELGRALGITGIPLVVQSDKNRAVLIMTNAGDSLDVVEPPKVAGSRADGRTSAKKLAMQASGVDIVGLAILDAVISNTDRHSHNFLIADLNNGAVKGNGYEEAQILPIDHGFAHVLNGNRYNVADVARYITGDGQRNGGLINHAFASQVGASLYKDLIDTKISSVLELITSGKIIQDATPTEKDEIVERLNKLKGISLDKWASKVAGRK